ncbi:hypothetical protein [Acinetobacter terrestris]|uniref:Uncharacterized protein n=1 Tax=Acinetobacter terrestris TaxID=2529843 RepID=A0AAW6UV31_9GAMM|nr:hypothetical protein [Acinetobacter terrestris]MDK1683495.1 hypothetical protein [Acinetobacter terrestris]
MKHQCLEHGNVGFCDGCLVDSLHYEIAQLKSKLNQKKSECAGLQGQIDKALVACHESGVLGVFFAIKVEDALRGDSK